MHSTPGSQVAHTPATRTDFTSTAPRQWINGDPSPWAAPANTFQWPAWSRHARIAGAYFHPSESRAVMETRINRLAKEAVSVIVADSPLGEQYNAWTDAAAFAATRATIEQVVDLAHARNLKVVLYHTGLELIAEPGRHPGVERPAWAQRALDGTPSVYNDVSKRDVHWLDTGIWDFWLHPCLCTQKDCGYSPLFFKRIRALVRTGIDGLWVDQVYLQSSVGTHHDLWPSSDPCSAKAFQQATGLSAPHQVDWGDPTFQRWVVWRHAQVTAYLRAEVAEARRINPQIVFLTENSCVDSSRSTYVATDPTAFHGIQDLATAHEIETIADRMDRGETGMQLATLDHWLAFRTMVAFARAADRGKPSWILTYGHGTRDSAQLAGLTVAEAANFYETKGPQMADSVGSNFRTALFRWIAAHEADLYAGESAAEVGLLYSARNRDLLDRVAGEPYDVADSIHFAAYRAAARALYMAHIPCDIVLDTDIERFDRYRVLIAPNLELMSDATANALHTFSGRLITVGDTGNYDDWLTPRPIAALATRKQVHFGAVSAALAVAADTGILGTTAPDTLQFGLHKAGDGYRLVVVNTGMTPCAGFVITLRVASPVSVHTASLSIFGLPSLESPLALHQTGAVLQIDVPAGIDCVALITVQAEAASTPA